ncbi:hypothetical protein D3D02_02630 [Halobellus sp. Atlit-38R]|jgi:hypothetical protein|uniref:DUF7091 family protein n=1 Tax=Halobellus sp. Atlit-38R TaxID=2282131 RepID=UPI000EF1F9FA|nr:hypothetical protein [Halobellus sp. Atlit-38R]RLM90687.1 hypothetical protein D3D02_02630 [Halobellus sp. Atlit-38R]
MSDRLERLLRAKFREAGRQYARARDAYREGRDAETGDEDRTAIPTAIPRDDDGRLRIVCRREADRRTVAVDAEGRPACFEAGHPDCEGCVEDLHDGIVETW